MSDSTRRRSKMLRLMLAAVALLGIGAAITAAAWEDHVYFEAEARGATLDVQGRIAEDDEGAPGEWTLYSDSTNGTPGSIELSVDLGDLLPGDTTAFWVQLRNPGTATAYLDDYSGDWALGSFADCDPVNGPLDYAGFTIVPSGAFTEIAPNGESPQIQLSVTAPEDWHSDCMGENDAFVIYVAFTSDPS